MTVDSPPTSTSPAAPAPPARPAAPRTWAVVRMLLTVAITALVAWALVRQFRQIPWDQVHFAPIWAALAVLCLLGVSGMQLIMFSRLLLAHGQSLAWPATLAAAWLPPLGKYVPGKVASIVGAVVIQRRYGVPAAVAVSVAIMLDALAVVAGLVVSAPLLYWHQGVRSTLPTAWAWSAALAALGLMALHPRVFSAAVNLLLRAVGRPGLGPPPRAGQLLVPVAAAFGQWVFAGLGLWLMTRSVIDIAATQIPMFIATAALAMTVSYLALFAPGGLGVREGIYILTLGPVIGPQTAIVVVAMRLVQTVIEVALAGVGLMCVRSRPAAGPVDSSGRAA